MRPLFNSQNTPPKFPITPNEQGADAQLDAPPRETFMGRELPTADQPLEKTSQEYYDSIDGLSDSGSVYLNYMLLGLYPPGPYDDSPNGARNVFHLKILTSELVRNRQLTALDELIQRCDSLTTISIDLSDFSADQLRQLLDNISTYQPELRSLEISGFRPNEDVQIIDIKAGILAEFISRSTYLKAFALSMISSEFSLPVITAIAKASHIESLTLGYGACLPDEAADKLQGLIRNSPGFKSISLSYDQIREEHVLKILLALQYCPQLEIINLRDTEVYAQENLTQLGQLIGKSTALKHFSICGTKFERVDLHSLAIRVIAAGIAENQSLTSVNLDFHNNWDIDIDELLKVVQAAKRHPCLQKLALNTQYRYRLPITRALADLVETNTNVVDVGIELTWLNQQLRQFFDELRNAYLYYSTSKDPWNDTELLRSSHNAELKKLCSTIEDKVARNNAIARGDIARIFSQAFFPSPGALPGTNHIGDPGLVLTDHILSLSPGLANFQNTMVEVALTVDETAKLEQETESAPNDTTNDQTIELRNTTNDDTKPNTQS
jgi:hypothetical protein